MGLFSRISNIVKAKANRAVEAAEKEDPVGIIKAQLQEAKKNLGEFESAVRQQGAEKIRLEKQVDSLKAEVKSWGKKAEIALGEGNEDLATKALERQTELENELESAKSSLKSITVRFDKMKAKVVSEKQKIDSCTKKVSTLQAQQNAAKANLKMRETISKYEGNGSAMDQIALYEEKVQALQNESEAADEMEEEATGADLDKQFEELESKSDVSDKMAALKAKMAKKETAEADA
jgi:phage shock protein A